MAAIRELFEDVFFSQKKKEPSTDRLLAEYAREDEAARSLYYSVLDDRSESEIQEMILKKDKNHKDDNDYISELQRQLKNLRLKLQEYRCPLTQDIPEVPVTLPGESGVYDKDMIEQYYASLAAEDKPFSSPCTRKEFKREKSGLIKESTLRFTNRIFSPDEEKTIQIRILEQDIAFLEQRLKALGVAPNQPRAIVAGPKPK